MCCAQKSVLFIAMHGSSLNNIIFMPRGAVVVELLPYKFYSNEYRKLALRSGLHYLSWGNIHPENAHYENDCLIKSGFAKLADEDCWRLRECVFCVRDKSITGVHAREFEEVLRNSKLLVKKWLQSIKQAPTLEERLRLDLGVKMGPI